MTVYGLMNEIDDLKALLADKDDAFAAVVRQRDAAESEVARLKEENSEMRAMLMAIHTGKPIGPKK